MYKKVMAAIDSSEIAKQALMEAMNIANSYNATLCIVHCLKGDTEVDKKAGAQLLEEAELSVSALSIESQLLEAETEYGSNGVAEAIANAATNWGADLLVVGTANRRGLERFLLGSVAEQLVAKIGSSILLVRSQVE